MSYSLALAALAACVIAPLIWWIARKHGSLKLATKLKKTHGLSSPATRSIAGHVKAAQAPPNKPNKFGKR